MYYCICGRNFKRKCDYTLHKKFCKGPKYCQNPECNKLLLGIGQRKFCSPSCSAKINNKNRKVSKETKNKISISHGGKGIELPKCLNCNAPLSNWRKYCNQDCLKEYRYKEMIRKPFEDWPKRRIREYFLIEHNNTCQKCGFHYIDEKTKDGPFQVHHVDGNKENWDKNNLEFLCLNCHWMTPNFAFRGRKHTKETIKILTEKTKNYYRTKKLALNQL